MTGTNPRDVFAIVAGTPPLRPQAKRCSAAAAGAFVIAQASAENAKAEAILPNFIFDLTPSTTNVELSRLLSHLRNLSRHS